MKPFLHIDDYGVDGFSQLTPLLALTEKVNIWAPSAYLLKQSNSILDIKDMLWLIENRYLSVTARRKWLFDKNFRNKHPWIGARWNEKLDASLRDISNEDERLPKSQRRVIIAEDEKGFDKAKSILCNPNKDSLERKLRNLYNKKLLPVGIQEKAENARKKRESVPKQIIRDYYNHLDAIAESASNSMVAPDSQFVLISSILGEKFIEYQPEESVSSYDFGNALKIIQALRPTITVKNLKSFLKSNHRKEIYSLLFEHQNKSIEIPTKISSQISTLLKGKASPFLSLTGFDQGISRGFAVSGGILSGLIGYYIDPSNPWGSIVITLACASIPFADYFGFISNKICDKKVAALVYLSHKRTEATNRELRAIEEKLSKIVF